MTTITGMIYMSERIREQLGIPRQSSIAIRVGAIVVHSKIIFTTSLRKRYLLSPELSKALYLRRGHKLRIRYDAQENMIHLGPTIGILVTGLPNRQEFDPTGVQAELMFLSHVGKTIPGYVYIFTATSINWGNLTTRGYRYRQATPGRGAWTSAVYPLPDVVYDRVPSRRSEASNVVKAAKTQLNQLPYLKYFNPAFLNKWEVYETLAGSPDLLQYLPETRKLTTETLEAMLERYPVLYLKPSNGSLGMGIIRVKKDSGGSLKYVIYRASRLKGNAENARDLMKKTKKVRGDKPYIVQEGLQLATYGGSIFDIRIIYQKNARGEWQISKKFARVAPRKSSVSNLRRGGRPVPSRYVFKHLYRSKESITSKNNQIKEMCKKVASVLETQCNGIYGELGLDIGMDKRGKPYLIEVNSKPRKTVESEYGKVIVRNTFKRPLEYSSYLAGFPISGKKRTKR